MPRQRTVKPEFFRDKVVARLGSQVALVYEALWCWADDGGVARIEPDLVKGEAFARWPEFTESVLTECFVRLHGARRIRPYAVGDELYAEIPTLQEHSPANHPSQFRYPRGGQEVADIRAFLTGQLSCIPTGALREPSASTSTTTTTTTPTAVSRKALVRSEPRDFSMAWANYPKRAGGNSRADALKAWGARVAEGVTVAELVAGVERYTTYLAATGNLGTQFVMQGARFFGPSRQWAEPWGAPVTLIGRLTQREKNLAVLDAELAKCDAEEAA